jgi:TPR repeat protein
MKRTFTSLVLGLALLVGGGGVGLAQDFDAGVAAYNRGDYATAFREFSVLAEQGDAIAQFNLGMMYSLGQGVTQDYREAARWFRLAAEQGDVRAQFNLGATYERGRGVTQDYREAMRWYRLAAEQGYADAQQKLGWMYFWAKGVTQNYVFAHMWFNIAASTGDAFALKNRDIAARKMTAPQIARAQELAKQCVAKNYKGC